MNANRDIQNLSQAEAAAIADVDRTTIRAWQQAGMPYEKPEGPGKPASYRSSIVLHWQIWVMLQKDLPTADVPKLTPPQAIAYAAAAVRFGDRWKGELEFAKCVRRILGPYYPAVVIDQAIGFALALNPNKRVA